MCEARIPAGLAELDQAMTPAGEDENAISAYMLASLCSDAHSPEPITALHRQLSARPGPDAATVGPYDPLAADRPLRLGHVSPHFLGHLAGYLMRPILEHHDPTGVAVHGYSLRASPDPFQQRLKGLVPHWHDCAGRTNDRLRSR